MSRSWTATATGSATSKASRRRLDYLESLGVDALWLGPSQPSPNRDDGYDVADYYGIDPRLGTSGDFVEFMNEADERGIRVLMDLVVNHTSDRHPWFREASRKRNSPFRDWYIWSDKRPRDFRSGVVFPGVQKTTWSYARSARAWYFHRFLDFQPDLNSTNPAVREEIKRIVAYWLRLGAAGFRIDAVPFLIEKPVPGQRSAAAALRVPARAAKDGAVAARGCRPARRGEHHAAKR